MVNRKPPARHLLRGILALGGAGLAISLAVACLPSPKGDYDDYVKDTENIRGQGGNTSDREVPDTALPDGSITGDYAMLCLPTLALGDTKLTLKFAAKVTYVPSASGGTITIAAKPLKKVATRIDEFSARADEEINKLDLSGPVGADKRFAFTLKTPQGIPGDTNTLSDSDIVLENGRLPGHFTSADSFCAELEGVITAPRTIDLNEAGDECVFKKPNADGTLPAVTADDFKSCP
jgi:hypothetical protein